MTTTRFIKSRRGAVAVGVAAAFGSVVVSAGPASAMPGEGQTYSCTLSSSVGDFVCGDEPDWAYSIGHPVLTCPTRMSRVARLECLDDASPGF